MAAKQVRDMEEALSAASDFFTDLQSDLDDLQKELDAANTRIEILEEELSNANYRIDDLT